MKIFYHKYSLKNQAPLNALELKSNIPQDQTREGLLFKFIFENDAVGFSSFHPHRVFGDSSADEIIERLKKEGKSLLQSSFSFLIANAKVDAEKKWTESFKQNKALSHYTASKPFLSPKELKAIRKQGFKRIKIKVGTHREQGLQELLAHYQKFNKNWEFIFDFNLQGEKEKIIASKDSLNTFKCFLEDPIPFLAIDWQELTEHGFKLLADQVPIEQLTQAQVPLAAVVIKPSRMDVEKALAQIPEEHSVMFTSSMGENIDIKTTHYWAYQWFKSQPQRFFGAGYLTTEFYQPNSYLSLSAAFELKLEEPSGWGQRDFLDSLSWTEV